MRQIERQRIPVAACGLQAVRLLRCDQGSKGLGFTRQPWKRRLTDVLAAGDDALRVDGAFGMGYGRGGSGGTCGFAGIGARSRRNSSMRARIIAKSAAARGRSWVVLPFGLLRAWFVEWRLTIRSAGHE
jgi:hypothetical protein